MVLDEEMIGIFNGELIRVCKRCKSEVVYEDFGELVSRDYDCACLVCDEDLYDCETELVKKEDVNLFITWEDKNYYIEHGHLSMKKLNWLKSKERIN